MSTFERIIVRDILDIDLTYRPNARKLFRMIDSAHAQSVVVDFSGIVFMSRSFAHEYFCRKQRSRKVVVEENLSPNVRKMLDVVENPVQRESFFDMENIPISTF